MLVNYMSCLSRDQLITLHGDLVNASLAFENKSDWRNIFKARRDKASGKRRKIYSALSKAHPSDIDAMIDAMCTLLPRGLQSG